MRPKVDWLMDSFRLERKLSAVDVHPATRFLLDLMKAILNLSNDVVVLLIVSLNQIQVNSLMDLVL